MSNINIKRAVENIRSGTTIYTPLVELTVNAIQAIRSIKASGGTVKITVLRCAQAEADRVPHVDGFTVADDGIGFTKANREAFDTLYTEFKLADGGKASDGSHVLSTLRM